MADTADTIVEAFLSLLAERAYADVTVGAIAEEAGVSLAVLNRHFPTRLDILRAFARRVDQAVLEADTSDMADEAPRDRLFDVLMTRLDALAPYRPALRSLMRSARRDPQLALALNRIARGSMTWMLAAAGVSVRGLRGRIAVDSLVVSLVKVGGVFLAEEDPGLPRTMAALDQALKALEARHNRLARFFGPAVSVERQPPEPSGETEEEPSGAEKEPAGDTGPMPAGEAEAGPDPVDAGGPGKPSPVAKAAASGSSGSKSARAKPKSRKSPRKAASKDEPDKS